MVNPSAVGSGAIHPQGTTLQQGNGNVRSATSTRPQLSPKGASNLLSPTKFSFKSAIKQVKSTATQVKSKVDSFLKGKMPKVGTAQQRTGLQSAAVSASRPEFSRTISNPELSRKARPEPQPRLSKANSNPELGRPVPKPRPDLLKSTSNLEFGRPVPKPRPDLLKSTSTPELVRPKPAPRLSRATSSSAQLPTQHKSVPVNKLNQLMNTVINAGETVGRVESNHRSAGETVKSSEKQRSKILDNLITRTIKANEALHKAKGNTNIEASGNAAQDKKEVKKSVERALHKLDKLEKSFGEYEKFISKEAKRFPDSGLEGFAKDAKTNVQLLHKMSANIKTKLKEGRDQTLDNISKHTELDTSKTDSKTKSKKSSFLPEMRASFRKRKQSAEKTTKEQPQPAPRPVASKQLDSKNAVVDQKEARNLSVTESTRPKVPVRKDSAQNVVPRKSPDSQVASNQRPVADISRPSSPPPTTSQNRPGRTSGVSGRAVARPSTQHRNPVGAVRRPVVAAKPAGAASKSAEVSAKNQLNNLMGRFEGAAGNISKANSAVTDAKASPGDYEKQRKANIALTTAKTDLEGIRKDLRKAHIDIQNGSNQYQTPLLKERASMSRELGALVEEKLSVLDGHSKEMVAAMRSIRHTSSLDKIVKEGDNPGASDAERLLASAAAERKIDQKVGDPDDAIQKRLDNLRGGASKPPSEAELIARLRNLKG